MQRDGGPGGAGGAGNPTGGSFTGPAEALELIGNHIYAYSGMKEINNVETSLIEATSGNYYAVGHLDFFMGTVTSDDYVFKVYMNGGLIMHLIMDSANNRDAFFNPPDLIIPSYTILKITGQNGTDTTSNDMGVSFTGRIYR